MKTLKTEFTNNNTLYVPQNDAIVNGKQGQIFEVYIVNGNKSLFQCSIFVKSPVTRSKVIESYF